MGDLQAGYGLDNNGYISSDVSIHKIPEVYEQCIQHSVEQLSRLFPNQLHSVYVYGSIARGDAIAIKSDLDLLAVFNSTLNASEKMKVKKLSTTLSETYRYLVRDIGIAVADLDHVMNPINYYEQAFLKELCVCIYGTDLRDCFGPYKLTAEIAISFNGDIGDVFDRTIDRLQSAPTEEFKKLSQNFARKLIRTYYSMVMARSQVWTTKLDEQSHVFIQYFQDKKHTVRMLQNWIEEAPTSREHVLKLFISEGTWLAAHFEREARMT
ncbi:nucleotidyltransferase domain-containing protein [Niallia circulans]|nr:nucleotidyltransferase domain-containing protein [Niallia circulans]